MKTNRAASRLVPALVIGLAAALALAAPAAQAQTSATATIPAAEKGAPDPYVEGQIAFMKAALEITPAQEARWNKVAAAIRANNDETQRVTAKLQAEPNKTRSAVQQIESQVQLAELSVRESQRFLDAFRPLYASLSNDQKATADQLIGQEETATGTAAPPPPNQPPPAKAPAPVAR